MYIKKTNIEKLYNPNKGIRYNTLKELVRSDKSYAIPVLRKFILIEKDNDLLFFARKSLDLLSSKIKKNISTMDLSDHEFIETLFSGNNASKIDVIQKAIKLGKKKFFNHIKAKLSQEKDYFVIATLVKAIGYLGDKNNAAEILLPYLKHKDCRVRANTCEALAVCLKDEAFNFIFPMINDPNPRVKVTAANYIINHSNEHDIDNILEKMAISKRLSDKSAILFLIDKIQSPRYSSLLLTLSRDKNESISRQATRILEKINRINIDEKHIDEFEMLSRVDKNKFNNEKKDASDKKSQDTYYLLIEKLHSEKNPDELKKIILNLEKLGDVRACEELKKVNSDSKVVSYFLNRALNKLKKSRKKIIICPNCSFQIRKESCE
ncbi:MAG: HEAT repeat domain-containing protein [Candidatus Muiribacteriota bacterium]